MATDAYQTSIQAFSVVDDEVCTRAQHNYPAMVAGKLIMTPRHNPWSATKKQTKIDDKSMKLENILRAANAHRRNLSDSIHQNTDQWYSFSLYLSRALQHFYVIRVWTDWTHRNNTFASKQKFKKKYFFGRTEMTSIQMN